MNWRHTHVWEINHQLVVADTIEDAIKVFKLYIDKGIIDEPITIQQIGNSDMINKDYSAIIGFDELQMFVEHSGTYVKDYERNPKPVPTDNKPIDIMDMMDNQYDVRWSTNDTQSNLKAHG